MWQVVLVGVIGLISSFISNISGGGGALVQMPALLAIGVPPLSALGSIKLGSLGLVGGSVLSSKGKAVVRREYFWPMLGIVTVASVLGPLITFQLPENYVTLISSGLIICTALLSLITWRQASTSHQPSNASKYLGYFLYFVAVVALAGIGSGMGIIANYILIGLLGMSALETVATRRAAGIIGVPLQFLMFAFSGHIDYKLGIALLIGSTIGSFLGMNVAIKQGSELIKRAMAIVSILLVLYVLIDLF